MSKAKSKPNNKILKKRLPVGSLVKVIVADRIEELAIIIDANYGYVRNSWYLVFGLDSGKQYHVFPDEVHILKKEKEKKMDE